MADLIIAKLSLPRIEKDIIARPRLLQLATEVTTKKLTLLTAPAGYGKTVLMSQLVKAILRPMVWYQLDSYDNDFIIFLKYLITGIRKIYPDFGKEALKLMELGEAITQQRLLIASIINDLATFAPNGLIIVLDDFHSITEPIIYDFIQELLAYLPDGIQLMIASRKKIPFPVDRLKLAGDLLMIGADKLSFGSEEIALFFAQRGQAISKKAVETLNSNINGWPAVLGLMRTTRLEETQTLSYEDHQEIYDYLATEILIELPKSIQSFLVDTSILQVFTAEFGNVLLERTDAEQILDYLETQQLFLVPLNGAVKSYRYHDLFRDFLQTKLGLERKKLLLYKAAKLTYQSGNPVQSCQYLLEAGVTDAHLPVLVEAGRKALGHGQWQTVAQWLKGLTDEQIRGNAWLSYFRAQVEIYRGRPDQAEGWTKNAAALFEADRDCLGLLEAKILKAKLLRCYGRYQESFKLLQEVEPKLPPEQIRNHVALYMEMYVVSCLIGRFKEGEAKLTQGLELIQPWKDGYLEAHLFEGLGTINYMLGNYSKALRMYKRGAEASPDRRLPSYYAQDNLGSIYEDWGELDQALEYGKRNVEIKEKLHLVEALPSAYLYLAGIYVDRGEFDLAENLYRKAIMMVKTNNSDHFGLSTILVFLARCLSLQGKMTEALQLVEEALREARGQSGLAWAIYQEIGSLVLICAGEIDKAEKMLLEAISAFKEMGYQKAICDCSAALALIYYSKNDPELAVRYTHESLGIASRLNLVQMFVTQYGLMEPVLRMGLEKGIEVTFTQRVLARLGDGSLPVLAALAINPEPAIRLRTIIPLMEIGTSRAKAIINGLIHDPNLEIREMVKRLSGGGDSPATLSDVFVSNCAKPTLELMMLGRLRVFINNTEISPESWRTVKVRDLLAYLVHRGEPVSAPQILEDLWPQFDREKAMANFHTTLYQLRLRLRQATGADLVLYGGRCYFVKPGGYSADYHRYEKLITANFREELSADGVAHLERALGMYRGDYLADLDYEWVVQVQEHLKNLYLESRMVLARYYSKHNEINQAIGHLRSAQSLNPLQEEIYSLLMTAYAEKGDRPAIRETYQQLKDVLKEELGLEPSKSTTELFHHLYK